MHISVSQYLNDKLLIFDIFYSDTSCNNLIPQCHFYGIASFIYSTLYYIVFYHLLLINIKFKNTTIYLLYAYTINLHYLIELLYS